MLKTNNKYLRFIFLVAVYIAGTLLLHVLLFKEPITYKVIITRTVSGILVAAIMSAIFKHGTPPAKDNNQNKGQ